jgi:hypothetical protein
VGQLISCQACGSVQKRFLGLLEPSVSEKLSIKVGACRVTSWSLQGPQIEVLACNSSAIDLKGGPRSPVFPAGRAVVSPRLQHRASPALYYFIYFVAVEPVIMASAGGKHLSAEERRRQRELEEARKAGLAPAEVSCWDIDRRSPAMAAARRRWGMCAVGLAAWRNVAVPGSSCTPQPWHSSHPEGPQRAWQRWLR